MRRAHHRTARRDARTPAAGTAALADCHNDCGHDDDTTPSDQEECDFRSAELGKGKYCRAARNEQASCEEAGDCERTTPDNRARHHPVFFRVDAAEMGGVFE